MENSENQNHPTPPGTPVKSNVTNSTPTTTTSTTTKTTTTNDSDLNQPQTNVENDETTIPNAAEALFNNNSFGIMKFTKKNLNLNY